MAKALLGYVGAVPDRRLVDEVTFLRTRVRDLEAEIARLRTDRDTSDLEHGLRQLSRAARARPGLEAGPFGPRLLRRRTGAASPCPGFAPRTAR